jgi:hypothetical protein
MDGVLFSLQFSIKEFSFPTASPAGDYMLFQRQLGNSSRRVVVGMDSDRIPMVRIEYPWIRIWLSLFTQIYFESESNTNLDGYLWIQI